MLRRWQRRLRLQDWDIDIRWARPDQLDVSSRVAEIDVSQHCKTANIRIAEPATLDVENSVVHELVHIHLDPFTRDLKGLQKELMEQAVDQLTRSFIAAYAE